MEFNFWDGPTSPPAKTLIKDKILDNFLKQELSFKRTNIIILRKENKLWKKK